MLVAAACGGGIATSTTPSSTTTSSSSGSSGALSPTAITACVRSRGGSAKLALGPAGPPGVRAQINGRLADAQYSILVFRSPQAAHQGLAAIVGMTGGSRTVDGVPVEQLLKRAGAFVILYSAAPTPRAAKLVESCLGGQAKLDADILASLAKPSGCHGSAGQAIHQMTDLGPPPTGAWGTPRPVEGGGCIVSFTSSEPTASVARLWMAELRLAGWTVSPPRTSGELLHAVRGPLGAVLSREGTGRYTLLVGPHTKGAPEGP
jgi:hypothetical protein